MSYKRHGVPESMEPVAMRHEERNPTADTVLSLVRPEEILVILKQYWN